MVLTGIRNNASDNDLLLASGLDCFAELGVVPSINLSLALNQWCIWIPAEYM
jgi:hypothetical protein